MSDDRLITAEDAAQLVEDGVFESFQEFMKTMMANGVAEACSQLSEAVSELDAGILMKEPDVINIVAQTKFYGDLIEAAEDGLREAQGDAVKTLYWKRIKEELTEVRQDSLTRMWEIAGDDSINTWHDIADFLERKFPNSSKLVAKYGEKLVGPTLISGFFAWEIGQIVNDPDLDHTAKAEGMAHFIGSELTAAAFSYTDVFKRFIANGVGTGIFSSRTFLATVARAAAVNLLATAMYTLVFNGAKKAFNAVGLYENDTFIECSDDFYNWLLGRNDAEEGAAIAQAVDLFSLLDPQFTDAALETVMGSKDDYRLMDYNRAKIAYNHLCAALGVDADTSSPEAFMQSVVKNYAVLLKEKNLTAQLSLQTLPVHSAQEVIANVMRDDEFGLATRYALVRSSLLVVTGGGIDYSQINADHSLDLYNAATGQGQLTENYIRDKAAMLQAFINRGDSTTLHDYIDIESGTIINSGLYAGAGRIFFGSDDDNDPDLEGTASDDRLYGGAGNDTLIGGAGADYLEGGQGVDTYVLNSSDKGVDTILDTDGLGRIMLDGEDLSGLSFKRPNIPIADGNAGQVYYAGQNNQYRLSKTSETQWQLAALVNGNYRILTNLENWKSGDLGITADSVSTPGVAPEDVKFDLDHSNSTLYHNYIGTSSPVGIWVRGSDSKSAQFSGSNHDDVIYTGNGNSNIVMGWTGNDYIRGGEGREYILAGSNIAGIANDNDVVYGGANSDIISGGGGNDTLWADDGSDSYLTETATSAERGDWINGQYGSDILYGSAQSDILFGGDGEDVIHGGAGNDLILGDANYTTNSNGTSLGSGTGIAAYRWDDTGKPQRLATDHYEATVVVANGGIFQWEWSATAADYTLVPGRNFLNSERVQGVGGNDYIDGGAGDDWIAGQTGDDIVYGGDGDDLIYGDDVVAYAGKGRDIPAGQFMMAA